MTSSEAMAFAGSLVRCRDDTPEEEAAIRCKAAVVIRDLAILVRGMDDKEG